MPLKQKAIENIGRSPNLHRGRVYLITCIARGVNDHEMPELLDFYHSKRDFLSSVHFMPLAHTWECGAMGFEPERITTEDIEELVDQRLPGRQGGLHPGRLHRPVLAGQLAVRQHEVPLPGRAPQLRERLHAGLRRRALLPISRYLRCSMTELGHDLMDIEKRLGGGRPIGRAAAERVGLLRKVRLGLALMRLFLRRVRLGAC